MLATFSLPIREVVALYEAFVSAATGDYGALDAILQTIVARSEGFCMSSSLVEWIRRLRYPINSLLYHEKRRYISYLPAP